MKPHLPMPRLLGVIANRLWGTTESRKLGWRRAFGSPIGCFSTGVTLVGAIGERAGDQFDHRGPQRGVRDELMFVGMNTARAAFVGFKMQHGLRCGRQITLGRLPPMIE